MEYKAKVVDGKVIIEPIIIKDKDGNITVKVPSLKLITKFQQEVNNGKRSI